MCSQPDPSLQPRVNAIKLFSTPPTPPQRKNLCSKPDSHQCTEHRCRDGSLAVITLSACSGGIILKSLLPSALSPQQPILTSLLSSPPVWFSNAHKMGSAFRLSEPSQQVQCHLKLFSLALPSSDTRPSCFHLSVFPKQPRFTDTSCYPLCYPDLPLFWANPKVCTFLLRLSPPSPPPILCSL